MALPVIPALGGVGSTEHGYKFKAKLVYRVHQTSSTPTRMESTQSKTMFKEHLNGPKHWAEDMEAGKNWIPTNGKVAHVTRA